MLSPRDCLLYNESQAFIVCPDCGCEQTRSACAATDTRFSAACAKPEAGMAAPLKRGAIYIILQITIYYDAKVN